LHCGVTASYHGNGTNDGTTNGTPADQEMKAHRNETKADVREIKTEMKTQIDFLASRNDYN
jgi:hypothetical protein